jgi:hypothetical protein
MAPFVPAPKTHPARRAGGLLPGHGASVYSRHRNGDPRGFRVATRAGLANFGPRGSSIKAPLRPARTDFRPERPSIATVASIAAPTVGAAASPATR